MNKKLASMIDHTILKPGSTKDEIKKVCDEAKEYGFATVCVMPENVAFVATELEGSSVKPISVVDFPKGAGSPKVKADETKQAIKDGAQEIDMVINYNALKNGDESLAFEGIKAVVDAAGKTPVKVIIETSELNNEQKALACEFAKKAGAAFVKTSTGFASGGATAEDIKLMRKTVGPEMGVKASGGIRTRDDADKMIAAGATRVGASASIAIVTGGKDDKKDY